LENITPGVVIFDDRGAFLHAKYEFQMDPMKLRTCKKGDVFRVSYVAKLTITPGFYTISLAMISLPAETIKEGKLSFADFNQKQQNVCATGSIVSFTVSYDPDRLGSQFTHLGTFDLPSRFGIEQDEVFE
ncbi:MAG TPA: hypothetical protein VE641_18785, partial [Chthoniobacterales bacterium]|nr:hypothetical protein [Chthoniobacterales bacterium]